MCKNAKFFYFKSSVCWIFCYCFLVVDDFFMFGVEFLTLLERKVLGYIRIRKGPNEVEFVGIFQSFRNVIKLFSREQYFPFVSNYLI